MFTGGTAGSTSGGIKIVRLLLDNKKQQTGIKKTDSSECFYPCALDKRIIPQSTVYNLLVFITIYFLMCRYLGICNLIYGL